MRRRKPPPPAGGSISKRGKLAEPKTPPEDRISVLPHAILAEIISILPTKDGARTQILASSWRYHWRSAPLNLDCRDLAVQNDFTPYKDVPTIVSRILSTHQGSGRRFCTKVYQMRGPDASVDVWLGSAALNGLQELELHCNKYYHRPPLPPPASTYRFSPTLCAATFGGCELPDGVVQALRFPKLKQLALEYVRISEHSLQNLIDIDCPALEGLLIYTSYGFSCLRINSLILRSISVRSWEADVYEDDELEFRKLIIENAPCLKSLIILYAHFGLHVSVISAPKLDTLGFLTDWQHPSAPSTRIEFASASTIIKGSRVDSLTAVVHAIKILAVNMEVLSLDNVIELMGCFLCLEKLHVKACLAGKKNLWRHKQHNPIDIRLKTLVLDTYMGTRSHVNFATFFILNAKQLESMTFHVDANVYTDEFLAEQRRKLQLHNKASRSALFHFTTGRCLHAAWSAKHLRDFDINDPFTCRC